MSFTRLAIVVLALSSSLPCLALAPLVRPGECLYLYGAPPGAPAAATEEFAHGTRVYDGCTFDTEAVVGRDAPHRLHAWTEFAGTPGLRGCVTVAWSEHRFVVGGRGPQHVRTIATGDVVGVTLARIDEDTGARMRLSALLVMHGRVSEVVLDKALIVEQDLPQSELRIDQDWGQGLDAVVEGGSVLSLRLEIELMGSEGLWLVDFGSPGTGRGAGYTSVEACVTSLGSGAESAEDQMERDLYEKRCLPSLWLPTHLGGKLDAALALLESRIDMAIASADAGANTTMASDRLDRARTELGRGQYQRACRSLSDGVRALTTP